MTAEAIETDNSFVVWCDFISGSEAHGCLVVVLGVHDSITVEVERGSSLVLNISTPLSCYHDVLAFDIEHETPGMPTVLRLLINDTSRNNQTVITCSRTFQTTLIVFRKYIGQLASSIITKEYIIPDPSLLELERSEVGLLDSINVSWSSSGQLSAAASVELSYSLIGGIQLVII